MADIKVRVDLRFENVDQEQAPKEVVAYALDRSGELVHSVEIEVDGDVGRTTLALPEELEGRKLRVLIGPRLQNDDGDKPTAVRLERYRALERLIHVEQGFVLEALIPADYWTHWLWCLCTVRGRVIKRVELPDGSTKELPICNARVRIFEVDRIPFLLRRLPSKLLVRMRDDMLGSIGADLGNLRLHPSPPRLTRRSLRSIGTELLRPLLIAGADKERIATLSDALDLDDLRHRLIRLPISIYRRFFCFWPWLDPFVFYSKDPIRTLKVDSSGEFAGFFAYPCLGDRPDLYFVVEQNQGGTWKTIYEPTVRCNTYWNYACGSEVTIVVTDPCAECCEPDQPVDVPPGVGTWIMPLEVGRTKIWGAPMGGGAAPRGWVRTDGLTDYGSDIDDAPFGSRLGFRMNYSSSLPTAGIVYYRWSYRKAGATDWERMDVPIYRRYERTLPGQLPTFPPHHLGPKDIGTEHDLFEFRPHSPPAPDPADPTGTTHAWPGRPFSDEINDSVLDSHLLPPNVAAAAGDYQVKVEVFDGSGAQVLPGAGTFTFLVPKAIAADGITIEAREATAAEVQGGAFVFNLHIDNRPTTATIDRPAIGSGSGATLTDDCGFLRYDPASSAKVKIAFHALHPAERALFNFYLRRGDNPSLIGHVTRKEVDPTLPALLGSKDDTSPYTGGGGNFSEEFDRSTLLGPTCPEGAFAQVLYVIAKATNGENRLSGYDSSEVTAFALAPEVQP